MASSLLTSPLKWHGGKFYLAKRIIAMMPPHIHYVEPFAGGLSVLLGKDPEGISEVANDTHGELTNFWDVLKGEATFAGFQRLVQATPFSEVEWDRVKRGEPAGDDPVTRAYRFFVLCRQSLAGRMKNFATLTRNRTRRNMNEQASAWINTIEGLPAVHERLKRVAILNDRAQKVIKTQDGENTLFYLDPPYVHETRSTTYEYGEHEMGEKEHEGLVELVAGCEGKVMLSIYEHPIYDRLVQKHRWKVAKFELPNNAARGANKRRMVECVYMNFTPKHGLGDKGKSGEVEVIEE